MSDYEYPIVLIPSAIKEIQSALPPLPTRPAPRPPAQPHSPQPPGQPPQPINTGLLWFMAGLGVVIGFGLLAINPGLGLLVLLVLGGGLSWGFWYNRVKLPDLRSQHQRQQQEYEQQKLRYQDQLKALPARQIEYQNALKQYEADVAQLKAEHHTPEKIAEFRRQQQRQILKQTISYDGDNCDARAGYSEKILAEQLNRYFPKKIHRRLMLAIPNYEKPFCPDFAYIDPVLKLHIDIEVDEPYVYETGEPIHYVGKDDRRNDFFLERGWIVIRFSEEQVRKNAKGCCKVVAQAVAEVTGNSASFVAWKSFPDLKPMPQWTEEEAMQMALTRKRDGYSVRRSRTSSVKKNQLNMNGKG